jgi:hypothetical protein
VPVKFFAECLAPFFLRSSCFVVRRFGSSLLPLTRSLCLDQFGRFSTPMKKLIPLFLVLLLLPACVVALGNRDSVRPATTPTLGQQLLDLQKARDTGAITEAEFQQQKSQLLQKK